MERVRVARPDDAAAIAAIYGPYVRDTAISFEETPPSIGEMRARIERTLAAYPYLVGEDEGDVVAYAYASRHAERAAYRWACDVTVYVAPHAHRRGFGRRLYSRLFELLARQRIHAAYAGITLPNDKSVGLHEAMGFESLGVYREVGFKGGAWRDVGWWQRVIGNGDPRGEPIPFRALSEGGLREREQET
jgi:phosphinothricin acetyltransferase